jgi:methyl-accepting chemotaxis protein
MSQTRQSGLGIRAKLTLQTLAVGILPLLLLGAGAYFTIGQSADIFGRSLEDSAKANLETAARELAAQIDGYMEERIKDALIWASDPLVVEAAIRADLVARRERKWPAYPAIAQQPDVIKRVEAEMAAARTLDPLPQATQYLKDQKAQSKLFKEIFITDRNGYNAAISNLTSDFVQSDEEWWTGAYTNGVFISRVKFDESAGVWATEVNVRIHEPRTREIVGVLKAVLDVSAIQALATRTVGKFPGSDVKIVVRSDGNLLADTAVAHDRKFIMAADGNLLKRSYKPAELLAQGAQPSGHWLGMGESYGTAPVVEQVVGYARTGGKGAFRELPDFDGLGWGVLVGQNKEVAFSTLNHLRGQQRELIWLVVGVLVVAALGTVAVGSVLGRRITEPIRQVSEAARKLSAGDLTVQVPVRSSDEIGRLASAFNDSVVRLSALVQTEADRDEERRKREELQQNIITFLDTVVEIGKGDLTRRGEVSRDVLGNVVDSINVMVEEIASIVGDVRQAALRVASGSQDTIRITGDMAEAVQAQSRDAVSVTRSVADMTVSVRQVADSADQSAKAARQVLQSASKGEEAVRNSLASMQQIRAEVQTISKKIKSLGDRSLEISNIVNTIQDIAAQTHLLALNASIEAAGAGDAGMRFSVVADEVRKLAERASQATRDIGTLIKGVQVETQDAVVAMESGTREVESGYEVSLRAEEALQEIGKISQTSAELAAEISHASQTQVRAAEATAGAVQAIAGAAAKTEQGVQQGRKNVEQLARLAEELTAKLSRFKLTS